MISRRSFLTRTAVVATAAAIGVGTGVARHVAAKPKSKIDEIESLMDRADEAKAKLRPVVEVCIYTREIDDQDRIILGGRNFSWQTTEVNWATGGEGAILNLGQCHDGEPEVTWRAVVTRIVNIHQRT